MSTESHNRDPMKVQIGDKVQYIWGWPGPDYEEGHVINVHEDGSFDADLGEGPFGGIRERVTLSDREGRITTGWFKITRSGINGF